VNFNKLRDCLWQFDFKELFIELGWSQPATHKTSNLTVKDTAFARKPVADLAGVAVFEILHASGAIPDAAIRALIHKETARDHHENILIFVDKQRSQCL